MKFRTLALMLTLPVGAAVAVAWLNLANAARARATVAQLSARDREVQDALRHAQPPKTTPAVHAQRADAPVTGAAPARPTPPPDASTLMAQNPELAALFQRYVEAELGLQFRPFYHVANLSPDLKKRFQALILEQRQEKMDLDSVLATADVTAADAARLRHELRQRQESEQLQLLGAENFSKYQDFTRTEPVQPLILTVATLGAETGEPLTEAQGERLLSILAKNSGSYQKGGTADPWTLDLNQVLIEAQTVLSPHQLAVLQGSADLGKAFQLAKAYQTARQQGAVHP